MTTCWMRFQDQAKETSLYHSNQGCTDRKTKMTSVIFYFLMTSISFTFSKFSKISNILSENLIVQFESCSIKFLISWHFKNHFRRTWTFLKLDFDEHWVWIYSRLCKGASKFGQFQIWLDGNRHREYKISWTTTRRYVYPV